MPRDLVERRHAGAEDPLDPGPHRVVGVAGEVRADEALVRGEHLDGVSRRVARLERLKIGDELGRHLDPLAGRIAAALQLDDDVDELEETRRWILSLRHVHALLHERTGLVVDRGGRDSGARVLARQPVEQLELLPRVERAGHAREIEDRGEVGSSVLGDELG